MTLRIALLGPPRVDVGGRPLVVDTRKAIALLAYLAVVDRPVAREPLADLLWPEADPDGARGALRRTLSVLRTALGGGGWLAIDRRLVALGREGVEVDVRSLRAALATGGPPLASALARYEGGEFLEGFTLRDSPPFDEWQLLEAEALRGELADGFRRLVADESATGRTAPAIAAARRLVALDPLDEASHRTLMTALAGAADRAGIERAFRDLSRVLERDLGVAPARETVALRAALIAAEPATLSHEPVVRDDDSPDGPDRRAGQGPEADVLAAAAILGDEVDPDLVSATTELPESDTATALESLVARSVLRQPTPGEPPDRYRFADPRARVAIVDTLGVARRRSLARRAAEARVRAGDRARADGRHDDAADHYRAALALGLPDTIAVQECLGDVETRRGRYGQAMAAYEAAAALADGARVAGLEHRLGALHLRRGSLELADLHLSSALARLGAESSAERSRILADRSQVALRRGQAVEAARLARAALRAARAVGDVAGEAQAANLSGVLARRAGDEPTARRHLRRSVEAARASRHVDAEVAALNNLSLLEREAGELDTALALAETALRRSAVTGDRHREAALRNNRADLLHLLGRERESAEELRRAVALFAEIGEPPSLEPEIWKLVDW